MECEKKKKILSHNSQNGCLSPLRQSTETQLRRKDRVERES